MFACPPGFLKLLVLKCLKQRFYRGRSVEGTGAFIFNQTAKEMYGLELGATLGQEGEIIGLMPDIKFSTFRNLVEPMCFYVWGTNNWGFTQPNAYIRIAAGTDIEKAIRHVHEAQEKFDSYKQDVRYFDEYIQAAYVKEKKPVLAHHSFQHYCHSHLGSGSLWPGCVRKRT
jgi:putative ABC transport system permease protein